MIDSVPRKVVTLGETMALLRPREIGSLRHLPDLALGVGGAESNVAIGLRRLGVDSSWLGRIGDDSLGQRVLREIRAEGVDVRVVIDQGARTGLMIKERPTASSTAVHYYRGGSAGSRLAPEDIPKGWIENAELLHVSGITALVSESARACLLAAIDRARRAGVRVSFDVNYRSALATADVARPLLRSIAELADIVFGGVEELELLYYGAEEQGAVTSLLAAGVGTVVVKRGADGASVFRGAARVDAPGFTVDVTDTVGAGDSFVAGYLSGLLDGLDHAEILLRANSCGALACTTPGDWEAGPTLAEIERFAAEGHDPVAR